jgi:dTDP-4-amino-4,6-dideoxygalactose transaminase
MKKAHFPPFKTCNPLTFTQDGNYTMNTPFIPFNSPYLTGKETAYIMEAVRFQHLSGNGYFTKKVHQFFKVRYGFPFCLLTTSCTDALEMAALLLRIAPGDEVILPSYTFVSTANAFALRGAKLVFADTTAQYPNISAEAIAPLITDKTKAVVVVHYAGAACDMRAIKELCDGHRLFLVEDAAQAIDGYFDGQPLGSFGDIACFSFHETKNIHCGEGGLLVVNRAEFRERAEILWEKGTNRSAFFRGQVDKYNWVDLGSSFLPSELNAAFLFAQLEALPEIQSRRKSIWKQYYESLAPFQHLGFSLPQVTDTASGNSHLFFLCCADIDERDELIAYLKQHQVMAVFHYISLHNSPYFKEKHPANRPLPHTDHFSDTLLRLPFYVNLSEAAISTITDTIITFYQNR